MGCCSSSDRELKPMLQQKESKDAEKREIVKVLLLGSGEGGKSTLFMNIQNDRSENALIHPLKMEQTVRILRGDLVFYMLQLLLKVCHLEQTDWDSNFTMCVDESQLGEVNVRRVKEFARLCHLISVRELDTLGRYTVYDADFSTHSPEILEKMASLIPELWSLDCVKQALIFYGCLSGSHFPDHIEFFFAKAQEIFSLDYIPSEDDILRCYIRTTGVARCNYLKNGLQFQINDVGAQKSERKKWDSLMNDVSALIFVAALNHYKSMLFEVSHVNAMHESISVFEEYINLKAFEKSSLFLILNKRDLFEQSLRKVPLSVCFSKEIEGWDGPEYWTGPDYAYTPGQQAPSEWPCVRPDFEMALEEALGFIQRQYVIRHKVANQMLNIHVVSLVNDETTKLLFSQIESLVIFNHLKPGVINSI